MALVEAMIIGNLRLIRKVIYLMLYEKMLSKLYYNCTGRKVLFAKDSDLFRIIINFTD